MASTTIRISEQAREQARELARATGKPISLAVEEAIRRERRRLFFDQGRRAVESVRSNPKAAREEAAEVALYETTLMDGLEDESASE